MAKANARRQPGSIQEWMDQAYAEHPNLRAEVEEELNHMRIAQDLVLLRERRKISHAQLAKLVGVSQPAIVKIESGRGTNIGVQTLVRIATVLGATVHISIKADGRARIAKGKKKVRA